MTPNTNEELVENASEYENWFFRLYTSKQRRRTQVGPCTAAETFSQKYWHFRPFSGKKNWGQNTQYPSNFWSTSGRTKEFLSTGWTALASKIKKKSNETYLLHFLYKIIVKNYFPWFFNWILSTAKSLSTLLSKFSKGISAGAQMPKTIFLGYFNRKTLALWKITSNKLIEKPKTLKQSFSEQFSKMNDAIASKNVIKTSKF